ncbi:VUT family protein [Desulfopila sp. IMCC35006]|uniref:queuosine precursor transporter n=1 Tax=Desulfopila sp. IMCC35006 TaxID=2569542 RepID=UPI0010ACE9C7|nr:queuosine precursor transporter [Desulfopila sp. IMCC35006]TKB24084.1 VUT family protein [Desulfopila sp. IMCC35006]
MTTLSLFLNSLSNESLWLLLLLANFSAILLAYRFFGQLGLYIWIPIATILANIQVLKMVDLLSIGVTLGNITYASSFLVTDILSENYGKQSAKKAVFIGFFSLAATVLIMQIALMFQPNEFDFIQESLKNIFAILPRIALASLIAYAISQFHDVWAYDLWKRLFPGIRFLWLRNNASTIISQLLDSVIFTSIAFWGLLPESEFLQILVTTYVLKLIVAVVDTPFLYVARVMFNRKIISEVPVEE